MAFDEKAYRKEYYQKNKEIKKAKQKEYYNMNKDTRSVYRKTIKGKYQQYKDNAKSRKYDFSLTEDEFKTFWQKPCTYCKDPIETIGIDRIDNNIGYQLNNLISCCSFCNIAKRNLSQEEFFDKIEKIYLNRKGLL